MQLSHYFLRNAGLVGGVVSNFSHIFAFDSDRKTCLLLKCKILYKNIVLSFLKQKIKQILE